MAAASVTQSGSDSAVGWRMDGVVLRLGVDVEAIEEGPPGPPGRRNLRRG